MAEIKTLVELERLAIQHALLVEPDLQKAAVLLGVSKTTIYRKVKEFGLTRGASLLAMAKPLAEIKQGRFLLLPRNEIERKQCEFTCPKCQSAVMLPNGGYRS